MLCHVRTVQTDVSGHVPAPALVLGVARRKGIMAVGVLRLDLPIAPLDDDLDLVLFTQIPRGFFGLSLRRRDLACAITSLALDRPPVRSR